MRTVLFVDDEQSIRNAIERMYLQRDDVVSDYLPIAEEVRANGR